MPPPSLTSILSALRAPIFNTLAVENNARTGTKYLRRRLRGPGVLNYIRQHRAIPPLNRFVKWNKYAGWDRLDRPDGKANYHLPPHEAVIPGFLEVERHPKPGTADKPNGWIEDGDELARFEDVNRKRKMGKGPVKKGALVSRRAKSSRGDGARRGEEVI